MGKMFFEMTPEEKKASGEQCEFCGSWISVWWYDPCCDEQVTKQRAQILEHNKTVLNMRKNYNQSLGITA